ncbi:MAG: glycosyltransferase family 39 protein [Caulobacterales bacterium]
MSRLQAAYFYVRSRPVDAAIALIGGFAFFYALTTLALPFGWDHGIMTAASAPYAHGGLPYRDSWDMKGPVAYLPFALADLLFGPSMWGTRLVDLVIEIPALWVLARCLSGVMNPKFGVLTALSYYLWYSASGWFYTAQPDAWAAAWSIIAIAPLLRPEAKPSLLMLAASGFFIGCAGLVKPFFFALGLVPLVFIALAQATWMKRFQLALALAGGAMVPLALVLIYFAAKGGLNALLEVHILFSLHSYSGADGSLKYSVDSLISFAGLASNALLAPFFVVGVWALRRNVRLLAILLAWWAVALLCVVIQGKFYPYHWFIVYPPSIVFAALGAYALFKESSALSAGRVLAIAAPTIFLLLVVAQPFKDAVKVAYFLGVAHNSDALLRTYSRDEFNAADEIAGARYLAAHTKPDDRVFVWGVDSYVGYLSGRPPASRFSFDLPVTMHSAYRDVYRAQMMTELRTHPPRYFVFGLPWKHDKAGSVADFPELRAFLAANYEIETRIGVLDIYRRVPRGI